MYGEQGVTEKVGCSIAEILNNAAIYLVILPDSFIWSQFQEYLSFNCGNLYYTEAAQTGKAQRVESSHLIFRSLKISAQLHVS